jgi:Ca-activated chloride channel family protein
MIRFSHPYILYSAAALFLFIILFFIARRKSKHQLGSFVNQVLWNKIAPRISTRKPALKFILLSVAFLLLVISAAGPQYGMNKQTVKRTGVDLMIALDISNSMLAQDVKPSRIDRAKLAIISLLPKLKGDRIGLVIFAGSSALQLPLTADYGAAQMLTEAVNVNLINTQGTNIGSAISRCVQAFQLSGSKGSKSIIVISDGEDHEEEALEEAKKAAEAGIRVFTMGIGSPTGVPIPKFVNGNFMGYRTDKNGSTVVTKLNEKALIELADAGKGKYIQGNNTSSALNSLYSEIQKMDKNEYESIENNMYINRFQYFMLAAFLFLLTESIISNQKTKRIIKPELFD